MYKILFDSISACPLYTRLLSPIFAVGFLANCPFFFVSSLSISFSHSFWMILITVFSKAFFLANVLQFFILISVLFFETATLENASFLTAITLAAYKNLDKLALFSIGNFSFSTFRIFASFSTGLFSKVNSVNLESIFDEVKTLSKVFI